MALVKSGVLTYDDCAIVNMPTPGIVTQVGGELA